VSPPQGSTGLPHVTRGPDIDYIRQYTKSAITYSPKIVLNVPYRSSSSCVSTWPVVNALWSVLRWSEISQLHSGEG
jgi:hypothetical protein